MRSRLPFRQHPARVPRHPGARLGLLASILVAACPSGLVAQQLPPAASAGPSASAAQPQHPQHHSQITLENGRLTVVATNASLNGLIREIARQTGMKITGSVADDRVFGTYGPGDPQQILATLLDGTGTNILILSSAHDTPLQLILTPRTGSASPPNPNAGLADTDSDDDGVPPPGAPTVISAPRARAAVLPGSVSSPPPQNNGSSPTVVFPAADGTSSPAASATPSPGSGATADPSADTVRTPQQIFEQLQRMRGGTNGAPTPQ